VGDNLLLYINGELSKATTAKGAIMGGEGILFVGAKGDYEATEGEFDELRMWNRALSAEEIRTNMGRTLTGSEDGLVACYPLDSTTRDMTGHGHDGVLMYKESFVPSQVHSAWRGDVNADGSVNVLDMITIANHILYVDELNPQEQVRADCNGDGNVNVLDMIAIANVILGIFEKCPENGCRPLVTPDVLALIRSMESSLSPQGLSRIMALVVEYEFPTECTLHQNYPNPFNPTTAISYQLPATSSPIHTTLKIFNILGQEVRTLVDTAQEAGSYSVIWDGKDSRGSEVPSGVYFCQMQAGGLVETNRMLLLR
jgi:hypothetical protein